MVEDREERGIGMAGSERIERALREELKLRKDLPEAELEKRIARAVEIMAKMSRFSKRIHPRDPLFRKIGRRKADEELRGKLAPKMKALLDVIGTLHMPASDALSNAGSQLGVIRDMLRSELEIIRTADLSEVPENPGRGRSFHYKLQSLLSFLLAEVFLDLTGKHPAAREKGRYKFPHFAREMYRAMEIKPPSDRTLRDACALAQSIISQVIEY